jgi:amidohydrolase
MSEVDVVNASIESARPALLEVSHFVHSHPEMGYEERLSAEFIAAAAEAAGFVVERGVASLATAFRATGGSGSLHVTFCAEYDALPDVGHACGHNIIAASSLGAAIGLAAVADQLDLTVTLLGTPSEEGGGGKIDLLDAGYFDDAHAAMMVHPWPSDRLDATCLAVDHFDVTFTGKDAHASAAPWEGINAGDAMTISQVALAHLRQQLRRGDQVHGIVVDGGFAANIIPSRVVGRFMARSVSSDALRHLRERVNRCFEAGAIATGARLHIEELGHQFSHMATDVELLAHYRRAAESLGRTFDEDDAGAALPTISTDMANVSLVVPSIHPLIGIPTNGAVNHQPEFTDACVGPAADQTVVDGARALALAAVGVALDTKLRARLLARS